MSVSLVGSVTAGTTFSTKDPDDTDLFGFDVSALLAAGDSIQGVPIVLTELAQGPGGVVMPLLVGEVSVVAGAGSTSTAPDTTSIQVWLSGGTIGATYTVSVEFDTQQGRTLRRSTKLLVARC